LDKQLRDDQDAATGIDGQLRDKRLLRSRLQRIDQALPKSADARSCWSNWPSWPTHRSCPTTFSQQRSRTLGELANARQNRLRGSRQIERLNASDRCSDHARGSVGTPFDHHPVARQAGRLSESGRGSARPGGSKGEHAAAGAVDPSGLGTRPRSGQAEQFRLNRVQRQRIQSLAADCQALTEKRNLVRQSLSKLEDQREHSQRERDGLPHAQDATELRRAIRRAQRHGDLDQQVSEAEAELQQLEIARRSN
jgi:hypothetical protein